ncbi:MULTISPECIES: tryptophanase [unclassified Crossiella]|uniref:tryptophanase n=1 Tax=unclassified Crossiella TaxID=2620835 RepID=UPI001FFF3588|nr:MULTISPECIES: tryptophanase [unclassified Crossiella]MCK2239584.1 tryptophanase [Crossiella sp. S99.2]MCK2252279.1 tryptophanase [Crossiella sp. S99.1]
MPLMEPYRIKVVEPIPITTPEQREAALVEAGYNQFNLPADVVTIDLLSDSGTGALSAAQQAASALGDESYAGARSFFRFREVAEELTGYPHLMPVHQGRAAERILFTALLKPGQFSVSNTHFDTTRANVELLGCTALDLPGPAAKNLDEPSPFKGDIDLEALRRVLTDGTPVGLVIMTITNNGGGGQPVSMANLEAVAQLCRTHEVPFFLDAARFAENAWLVTQREPGYENHTPREVARLAFDLADGCVASLKKDGIVNMGGLLALRDADLAGRCELLLIATEGFRTYGGLAGRDLDMLAQGLREVTDPAYLATRADQSRYLGDLAVAAGVSIVQPAGIHAIYLNAGRLLTHLPPSAFPGHALALELYRRGGIRCAELGSLYLGEFDEESELTKPAPHELVRLAIPRRVYTQSHLEYVGEILAEIAKDPERVPGYRLTHNPPLLRHFNCRLAPRA